MTRYILEARDDEGKLKFDCEQAPQRPSCEHSPGGFTDDDLAKMCFAVNPDAILDGRHVLRWVSDNVNKHWKTRVKTW
jgi:hypothetical protein